MEKRGKVIRYHKESAEVRKGLDESRAKEWAKWMKHRAVDDTDKNEHLKLDQKGAPDMVNPFQQIKKPEGYVPNYKSRLVARGNQ